MSLFQDQVTKYNSNKKLTLVAYDLCLNQSMYRVPRKIVRELERDFSIKLDPVNCPDKKKLNPLAEIYWGNRIELNMMNEMPNLKWVHFGSVGVDRLNNYTKKDILITSSKGLVTESIVTHVISLIGLFSRRIDVFFDNLGRPFNRNDYEKYFNNLKNFNELNILIMGLGDIGSVLAEKLFFLNSKVDGVSRSKSENKFVLNQYNLKECLEHLHKYDFIVSLLPENNETKNFVNYDFFKKLSRNSIFLNVGRGSTVVEDDLLKALNNKILRKAILDVTTIEPLSKDSLIYKNKNIFLTPHIAAFSPTYWELEEKLFRYNLKCYQNNEISKMKNLENPMVY